MKINFLTNDTGEDIFYSNEFIVLIESHLEYLRTTNSQLISVTDLQSYKYEGDLYGLLEELRYEKKFHYAITRVNGYKNSNDYNGEPISLLIPSLSEIVRIASILQTETI